MTGEPTAGGAGARATWPAAVRIGVLVALLVVLYLPQLAHLAGNVWSQEKYSHGWLVPVISAGWVLGRWRRLAAVPSRPADLGLVPILLGVAAWVYAQNKSFNALAHLSMLLTIAGVVAFAGGWGRLRAASFAVFYLVFMFPVPRRLDDLYIVLPLQAFAARVAEGVLRFVAIPVVREGNVLEVPGARLLVEEACSGIHSLYSLLALGTAVVFLFRFRGWVRAVLILSTVPIAIVANVVRVAGTGIIAYLVSADAAEGFTHTVAGLAVFLLGLVLFLALAAGMNALFPVREAGGGP